MKNRFWIAAVVAAQLAVVFWMAAQREWILRRAPIIVLRTAPVDPDDPMRGAYSQLAYELNEVPKALCGDALKTWFGVADLADYHRRKNYRDTVVYATLSTGLDRVTRLVALSDQKPDSGQFIRGRVSEVSASSIRVRYGIEAYFSDKKRAVELDKVRRETRLGVPLNVDVAVASSGLAVLKSLDWEPLGIVVRILREPGTLMRNGTAQTIQVPKKIEVEIKNHGDLPVGLVIRPEGRSFRLVAVSDGTEPEYSWVNQSQELPRASASDVRILAAGQSYREVLLVNDPYWAINYQPRDKKTGVQATSLDKIEDLWSAVFRVEYVPGPGSETLSSEVPIRPQPLLSARWWPNRGSD